MGSNRNKGRKQEIARRNRVQARTNARVNAALGTISADTVNLQPGALVSATRTQMTAYSGPFPSPTMLADYEIVLPGSAELLLDLYRKQVHHRMKLEDRVTKGDNIRAYLGWLSATGISLFLISIGGYLIYTDHDTAGGSIISLNLVTVAGIFLYGVESRRREREAKAKARDSQEVQGGTETVDVTPKNQEGSVPSDGAKGEPCPELPTSEPLPSTGTDSGNNITE